MTNAEFARDVGAKAAIGILEEARRHVMPDDIADLCAGMLEASAACFAHHASKRATRRVLLLLARSLRPSPDDAETVQ